jgi:tyrosine-protein kinase Etk/Wzc
MTFMSPKNEIALPTLSLPQDFQEEEIDLSYYLAVLAESKWLILLVTALVLAAGVAYILIATPIYQADALIQVDEEKSSGSALRDISDLMLSPLLSSGTVVNAELEILGSRLVLGKAVDNLRLAIVARPAYFPVIGQAIARRQDPAKGLVEPWFGLNQYAWGGESIQVQTFDVPVANLDDSFILEAGEAGRYRLLGPKKLLSFDLPFVLEGKVGQTARAQLDGGPLTLFVSELKARPGTRFKLVRNDLLNTITNLTEKQLKMEEEGKDSGIISVTLKDPDPARASAIVNEVANIYLRQNVERKSAEAAQTLGFLEQQLPALKKNMEASEIALNAFRQRQGSVDLPKEIGIVLDKITAVQEQLLQLKQRREELIRKFTPAHPAVAALDAQTARLNKELGDLNKQVKNLPDTEQDVIRLTLDARVNTDLYTDLLNRSQELQVAKAGTVGTVRIIDYAITPIKPSWPKAALVLALALVLGVFLGIVTAFLRKSLAGGIEDPDQLEKQLGLPVYATIPHSVQQGRLNRRLRARSSQEAVLASHFPEDITVESLRSLRTTLHFVLMDAKNNLIMITGPSPTIGKSFITVNLGTVLASAGKRVLLIDADLRKGRLNRYLGLDRELGLANFISDTATLEQIIHPTSVERLDLITTGTIPPNPSELLLHERFALCLDELVKTYDYVLIDCAPVLAVADAAIVGRLAGTALLVLKAGVHPLREIEQSVKRLKQAGVNLRGLLFNEVQLASRRYGYGKYKYVYQYSYNKQ